MKYKAYCLIVIKKLLPLLSNAHLQEEKCLIFLKLTQEFERRFMGHFKSMLKWFMDFLKILYDKLRLETYLYKVFFTVKLINKLSFYMNLLEVT